MFHEGDRVVWSKAAGIPTGTGYIRGMATTEQASIGRGYIVQPDKPIENYEYSHVVLFECHLKLVPNILVNELVETDEWVWEKGTLGRCMSC